MTTKPYLSDAEWEEAMLKTEDKIISYSNIKIEKSFINIEIEGQPQRVRVFECGDKSKPTIVCLSGYHYTQLQFMSLWTALAERYRVVTFELGVKGLNTRLKYSSGIESIEAAEEWNILWLRKVFAELDLPLKFHLVGQCFAGHLLALYASMFPERIESYFGISPPGFIPYAEHPDPYVFKFSDPTGVPSRFPSGRAYITDRMEEERNKKHYLHKLEGKPYEVQYAAAIPFVNNNLKELATPKGYREALMENFAVSNMRMSVVLSV